MKPARLFFAAVLLFAATVSFGQQSFMDSAGVIKAESNYYPWGGELGTAATGSVNFRALESSAVKLARSEGASSLTIRAVNVIDAKLTKALTRAGYTAEKITDTFGRETVDYVESVTLGL